MHANSNPETNSVFSPLTLKEGHRAQHRPARYPLTWVVMLLLCDIVMFVLATVAATALVLSTHPLKLPNLDPVIQSSVMIIVFQLLMFERLGLYRQSFALTQRDEFYYVTTAVAIGGLPLLVLFTAVPQLSSSRLIILVSLAFSVAAVGVARAIMRNGRSARLALRPRKVAIVGRFERTEAAAASLNVIDGTIVLRINVDNLDESISRLRPLFESDLSEIPWFAEATRCC
jgi:FlaA1/EpsC-like NDP-sugar epimerase